jgi:hypothetical protein
MEDNKTFLQWVKEHKTELIVAGVTIVGTVLVIKNWDSIKGMFQTVEAGVPTIAEIKPIPKIAIPTISQDVLNNLTGVKLTATELGNHVWCSPQAINKRIVAAGLATRLPCGDYILTEAGRLIGEDTWKVTRYGHSFTNIEWDKKILEIIFSPEELLEIANKQTKAAKVLEGAVA